MGYEISHSHFSPNTLPMINHSVIGYRLKLGLFYDSNCDIFLDLMGGAVLKVAARHWLSYVLTHDPALKQYFSSRRLEEQREQLMELDQLGFPFLERLQEFIPYYKQRHRTLFKFGLMYPSSED
jgi:hypothetical protein